MKTWRQFVEDQDQYGREMDSPDDGTEEMVQFNRRYSKKDQVKMLLWMGGVTDADKVDYADDAALERLLTSIVISDEYRALLSYLRS